MKGFEILARLPLDVQERFIHNVKFSRSELKPGLDFILHEHTFEDGLETELIQGGFEWEMTDEGFSYWSNICSNLKILLNERK